MNFYQRNVLADTLRGLGYHNLAKHSTICETKLAKIYVNLAKYVAQKNQRIDILLQLYEGNLINA